MPTGRRTDHPGSANEILRQQFNLLLAKLDADVGITDTNYAALLKVELVGEDRG